MTLDLVGRLQTARIGLQCTFRERAHLPGSPWFAFLGAITGNVIIARADDPEAPIPEDWRKVCPVNNARTDDANMLAIADALRRMPLGGAR